MAKLSELSRFESQPSELSRPVRFARENPWKAVALAAAGGLVVVPFVTSVTGKTVLKTVLLNLVKNRIV